MAISRKIKKGKCLGGDGPYILKMSRESLE